MNSKTAGLHFVQVSNTGYRLVNSVRLLQQHGTILEHCDAPC